MDKNIYIELANTLDSAGLFRESDDLMEVISSNASMIKTAQSPELDKVLGNVKNLHNFNEIIFKAFPGGSIPAGIVTFFAQKKKDEIDIDQSFSAYKDVPDEEFYIKKTLDMTLINQVKQQADKAKGLPNDQKTLVEVLVPNNKNPFSPEDPSSYTKEKYYIPDQINKNVKGVLKPYKNSLITKMSDPYNYIKDIMNGDAPETFPVSKTRKEKYTPGDQIDPKLKAEKTLRKARIAKSITAMLLGLGAATAAVYGEFTHKYLPSLPSKIKSEYNLLKRYYDSQSKKGNVKELQNTAVEKLRSQLEKLLSRCDGKFQRFTFGYTREQFINEILAVFKKEIGYGKSGTLTSRPSNSQQPASSPPQRPEAPNRKPRTQTPSKPAPSSGGSTGGGASADL